MTEITDKDYPPVGGSPMSSDEGLWIAAYLAALAGGHRAPELEADVAVDEWEKRWGNEYGEGSATDRD